jgi:hypothetical protein
LAWQSSQVAQKNQQEIFVELSGEIDRFAVEIQQRQLYYRDVFHDVRQDSCKLLEL